MRKLLFLAFVPLLLLAACGGAGVTGNPGGGGGGGTPPPTQTIAPVGPPNVELLTMDTGPSGLSPSALNTAFVTIVVCLPGTTTCQTVDHIEVDTGSSGLRILSAALPAGFNLPVQTTAGGMTVAECLPFADGSSFGPVVTADLQLPKSGKTASGINVQLIGAPGYTLPSDCMTQPENTVDTFGANGILGVGPFLQDCGAACAQQVIPMAYYNCSGAAPMTCAGATLAVAQQVSNPVGSFDDGMDNNGVIVELPAVAAGGAATISGALVFGIGTETNNVLGSATVLPADDYGYVRAAFNGQTGLFAALDSGSTLIYFTDSIPTCASPLTGLYCPNSTLSLTATLTGASGSPSKAAPFSVQSGTVLNTTPADFAAVPQLGGPLSVVNSPPSPAEVIQFDLGMPFYFGQNVYTAIEGQSTPGGTGPYFAY